jgi:TRAP-type C4-dicarboxylate transport system permease small subunit
MAFLDAAREASRLVNRAAIVVCITCVVAMLAISFAGFTYTVLTGGALSWTYSLARVFLPWIGMISITIALYSGEHVAMTILVKLLPKPLLRVFAVACLVVIGVFALLLVWYGWQFFINARQTYMVSDMIQIPQYYTAVAVPLTGVITLLHLVNGYGLLEHFVKSDEHVIRDALGQSPDDVS